MLETKKLLVAIDFLVFTYNGSQWLPAMLFCAQQKKEIHTGMKWHEGE